MTLDNPVPVGDQEQRTFENSSDAKRVIDVVGNSLIPSSYDYIGLSYDTSSSNLTGCAFKLGGSTGSSVSILLLSYDTASKLTSVSKV